MSHKKAFISHIKSLTEKKFPFSQISSKNKLQFQDNLKSESKSPTSLFLYLLTQKNLKKYSTNKKTYNIFIINNIIFDHRIHKVAVFKNNLLWDESSEFLKRFYKKRECIERIPKISEYYEKYTLFPPVYFGLEGLIVVIMNKWTKRKKNYLEYIEDHEEDKKKAKNKNSFEPLINNSSINNITLSKSLISKNTLELTKFENESKKSLMNNNNKNNLINDNKNGCLTNRDKANNLSFSDIIDDLSSNYSVIINSNNKNNEKKNKNTVKKELKTKKILNINEIDKTRNNLYYSNNITLNYTNNKKTNINLTSKKLNIKNAELSPKKYVKISLNKNSNKIIIKNNNPNVLYRNNNNNLPIPSVKKYQKRILNTENIIKNNLYNKNTSKGTIRVNTISSYIQEKSKVSNNSHQLPNKNKENSVSLKKFNLNFERNNTNKNLILTNKKQYINYINNININNSDEKNKNKIIKNKNNVLKKKNYIQIKKEPFLSINSLNNSLNKYKQTTYRNAKIIPNMNNLNEMMSNPNISKHNLISNNPKINMEIMNPKKIKDIVNNTKKLYLEDPFIYKLSQLNNKKKIISLTTANSLSRIKNMSINGFHSKTKNNISNTNNNSKNKLKINHKKNLVLTKLNSKNNLIYNKKRKLIGDNSIRNNSANSSLIPKTNDSSLNFNISNKKTNTWKNSNKNKNANSKNINLNLNLNIHFNIGLENKNKGKKILFKNTIINNMQNKTNKNTKFTNINKSKDKDINYKYPLTSRESISRIKDMIDMNKIEYTLFKKS